MTKQEFKARWESDDQGGGITFEDVAEVAKVRGLCHTPRIRPMSEVLSLLVGAAEVREEDFEASDNEGDDE